jgi:hypothetical protein
MFKISKLEMIESIFLDDETHKPAAAPLTKSKKIRTKPIKKVNRKPYGQNNLEFGESELRILARFIAYHFKTLEAWKAATEKDKWDLFFKRVTITMIWSIC